jgi:hypothetical protein
MPVCHERRGVHRAAEANAARSLKKRKHGDDDAARGEPWSLALLESCETADSPEEAVFSMKNQFAHIWIDKYDKLLDAAVRFSFRLRG